MTEVTQLHVLSLEGKKQSMKGGPWMENHGWIMKVPHTP